MITAHLIDDVIGYQSKRFLHYRFVSFDCISLSTHAHESNCRLFDSIKEIIINRTVCKLSLYKDDGSLSSRLQLTEFNDWQGISRADVSVRLAACHQASLLSSF